MGEVKVTDGDIEAALNLVQNWPPLQMPTMHQIAQHFARHRHPRIEGTAVTNHEPHPLDSALLTVLNVLPDIPQRLKAIAVFREKVEREAHQSEYICKCGLRVEPHRCRDTKGDF